ncbi:hypothetical protein CEXT_113761 [Caerostris extrusa]|uniref:Uncharacterized protein n=1 Tax=Caerostris extrusa TaxID=172846 RepID=A0AAV4QXU3_CAEEX|nr:hypothetical protein CEXT_113761 [Caerostris extrusa]
MIAPASRRLQALKFSQIALKIKRLSERSNPLPEFIPIFPFRHPVPVIRLNLPGWSSSTASPATDMQPLLDWRFEGQLVSHRQSEQLAAKISPPVAL